MHITHWRIFRRDSLLVEALIRIFELKLLVLLNWSIFASWDGVGSRVQADGAFCRHYNHLGAVRRYLTLVDAGWSYVTNVPKETLFANLPYSLAFQDVNESDPATFVIQEDKLLCHWMGFDID